MAIQQLVDDVVNFLNNVTPGAPWQGQPWLDNVRPWARIYHNTMLLNWPATNKDSYPVFCFEIKCVNDRPEHDGGGPYSIYIALAGRNRVEIPANIDSCLQHLANQLNNVNNNWRNQLNVAIDVYRNDQRRFELDPRLIFDDTYLDTAVGYIMRRKQFFL